MKIQLLIAVGETDYAEHLSRVLAKKHADTFEISVCSKVMLVEELTVGQHFDLALLDSEMAEVAELSAIRLPLLLWDDTTVLSEKTRGLARIRKYQRISEIGSEVTLQYASITSTQDNLSSTRATITAVWSPAGGCGKTTVALAYAVQRAADGKRTVYLDLEPFSAAPVCFKEPGKSISEVFEKLDGDVPLLLQSIRQEDSLTGICYFGRPKNYDDINILTGEDVSILLEGCAAGSNELVVDLGSTCGVLEQQVLNVADQVLLVEDGSAVCRTKCDQFRTQHNLYEAILPKTIVVANRGTRNCGAEREKVLTLPKVGSDDPVAVFRTLSGYMRQEIEGR